MTSPHAIVANSNSTATNSTSSSSSQNAPSNTLGPNSFITLLTAQLQAQDPLSPMDPDQMVNELTSINTLQQIMQIRSDMDTLVSTLQGTQSQASSGSGSNSGTGSGSTSSANAAAVAAAKQQSQLISNPQFN